MENLPRPIGLLTDFGLNDWYVAAMKGRIVERLPGAQIIDLTHGVPPHQIQSGCFLLNCVLSAMPQGMVFCCVVDPEVGTARRAMCGRIGSWFYSGPDNGLASPLLWQAGDDYELYEIVAEYFRGPHVSATFHGRDLFAPAAAALASGVSPREAGPIISDPILLPQSIPYAIEHGLMAHVMVVDRFGNLVTDLLRSQEEESLARGGYVIQAGSLQIRELSSTYAAGKGACGLAYWGSAGTLEIGVNQASAAELTGLGPGDEISITWEY